MEDLLNQSVQTVGHAIHFFREQGIFMNALFRFFGELLARFPQIGKREEVEMRGAQRLNEKGEGSLDPLRKLFETLLESRRGKPDFEGLNGNQGISKAVQTCLNSAQKVSDLLPRAPLRLQAHLRCVEVRAGNPRGKADAVLLLKGCASAVPALSKETETDSVGVDCVC